MTFEQTGSPPNHNTVRASSPPDEAAAAAVVEPAGRPRARRRASWNALVLACWFGWVAGAPPLQAQNAPNSAGTNFLHLKSFLRLVLERNESVQLRVLELEITKKKFKAEYGIFEPDLVLSVTRDDNKRENTAEQRRSLGIPIFEEQNNIYNAGLESLIPSGAKVRLGYNLRDLNNNIQDPRFPANTITTNRSGIDEYQTFAGVSVVQPLLKNFGYKSTFAAIRLAALASEIAYHEYRRQLMETIAGAEAAYWNLFMAQEQVKFFRDSVALAASIVRDNRVRAEAGKGSDLEVLEAESALALRQTKLAEAEQKHQEAAMRVMTLYSEAAVSPAIAIEAVDHPQVEQLIPDFLRSAETAFDFNPDYLAQQKKIRQEDIRVAYAKNQRLPQLDLRASYGLNGLGDTPGASHRDIEDRGFPNMSVGIELHVPLAGNIKARNELEGARLRRQQALLSLKQIETQIINAVQAALQKIRSARDSIESNQKVVAFIQNLLTNQIERLDVGRIESRKVLETEAALFESRNAVLDSQVAYERARLELELVQGATLTARNVDFSQKELQDRTALLLSQRARSDSDYREFMQSLYATPPAEAAAVNESEDMRRARRILREKLDELERNRAAGDTGGSPALRNPEAPPSPQTGRGPGDTLPPATPPPAENTAPPVNNDDLEKARQILREKLEGPAAPKTE